MEKKLIGIRGMVNRNKREKLYALWAKHQKKPTRQKFSEIIVEVGFRKVEFDIKRWS